MITLYHTFNNSTDKEAVVAVLERGSHWAEGPEIIAFETGLSKVMWAKYALVCNSGTSALHLAMIGCDIKEGDEVIVPSFTFIATANAATFVGATPVFADIEPETYGLDALSVEDKITRKTKAIVAVHYAGQRCQLEDLHKVARKHHLLLIEDTAEAIGACPLTGDCAILSFCANKVISTGEGGALVTNNETIYERAKLACSHGRSTNNNFTSSKKDSYVTPGYNFRMSSMTAALGLSQLSKLNKIIEMRRQVAQWYCDRLGMPLIDNHVYQLFTIRHKERDRLQAHLADNGIISRIYFYPVHQSEYYNSKEMLPVTEKLSREVLSLPIYPGLTESEVDYICKKIKEV